MCGITGWVDFGRDLRGERTAIEAMTATMTPRGPDAGGVWCSAHAAIGHRRLAVIDLPCGQQPMRAPGADDVVLTFSGEIYNFTELRGELTSYGHAFRTRSDTEVLLHSYLRWGTDCVRRLNGMFAFGLWDGRRQELLLARDRLGVKPLYYAVRPDGVLFGSEPKAILAHPEFRAEIDAEGIAELFGQFGAKTPGHGIYRGLTELRPGTIAVVGRGGTVTSAYGAAPGRPLVINLVARRGNREVLLATASRPQTPVSAAHVTFWTTRRRNLGLDRERFTPGQGVVQRDSAMAGAMTGGGRDRPAPACPPPANPPCARRRPAADSSPDMTGI